MSGTLDFARNVKKKINLAVIPSLTVFTEYIGVQTLFKEWYNLEYLYNLESVGDE